MELLLIVIPLGWALGIILHPLANANRTAVRVPAAPSEIRWERAPRRGVRSWRILMN